MAPLHNQKQFTLHYICHTSVCANSSFFHQMISTQKIVLRNGQNKQTECGLSSWKCSEAEHFLKLMNQICDNIVHSEQGLSLPLLPSFLLPFISPSFSLSSSQVWVSDVEGVLSSMARQLVKTKTLLFKRITTLLVGLH